MLRMYTLDIEPTMTWMTAVFSDSLRVWKKVELTPAIADWISLVGVPGSKRAILFALWFKKMLLAMANEMDTPLV